MHSQVIGPDEPSFFEGVDEITAGQRLMNTGDLLSTRFRIEEIDGARATAHPLAPELRKAGAGLHPQGLVVEGTPTPRR